MTIAITIKVHDGIVLAADSASTLFNPNGGVDYVYNNANKVFNLYKGLPIGAMTWGLGGIGNVSISTLMKDLRNKFMGLDKDSDDVRIEPKSYQMDKVASDVKDYFVAKYDEVFKGVNNPPVLGFMVAGYSTGKNLSEEYQIIFYNGNVDGPKLIRDPNLSGISWNGEIDAIQRLLLGFGVQVPQALIDLGIKPDQIDATLQYIRSKSEYTLVPPPMPIQDAIDLAEFLVKTTIMFSRFTPGAATVGGPIEIATITKHEDFKWVKRKHYFDEKLNPRNMICPHNHESSHTEGG